MRHGQPEGGEVLRGRVDHVLSDIGWQQMHRSVTRIETPRWTEIITSPLQRCHAFAARLSQQQQIPLTIESNWQEIDYGDWDGMPLTLWREAAADQFRRFRKDITALAPPNGENFVSFSDRILNCWQQILNKPDGSRVLLVTHGGVMRVVLPTVLGIPLNHTSVLDIPFACLSRVEIRNTGSGDKQRRSSVLVSHNNGG